MNDLHCSCNCGHEGVHMALGSDELRDLLLVQIGFKGTMKVEILKDGIIEDVLIIPIEIKTKPNLEYSLNVIFRDEADKFILVTRLS